MFHGQTINKQKLEQRSGYVLDNFESRQDKRFFSSPKCPVLIWVPPSFLFNMYRGIFPAVKSGRGDKFTTHLHHPEPKNELSCTSTPLVCFHAMDRDFFAFSPFWNFCLNRRWSVIARDRPQEKSHCSGSDQSSAALNRDRNKKIRIGHALPTCHQSRQAHHLTLYAMDLSYRLQRFCCPQLYCQETAPPYHFDLSAPHPHCPSPLTWPTKFWQM